MSTMASVETLLRASMGLDARSIGFAAIGRAVHQRLAATDVPDVAAYWDRLRCSAVELQELIETVVVSETWFFRDQQAFATLASTAVEEWLPSRPERILRLLSLPSSTGEEPYSMAMALLDAGIPANRFRIDAVDISERVLARARHGTYGRNSFRTTDLGFRDRHFDLTDGGHRVSDRVREQVSFQPGNLFAATFLPGVEIYDVIFCRNLLIYFDRPTQVAAIAVLDRLLVRDGLLFVAPCETGLLLARGFLCTKTSLAFALRKRTAADRAPKPKPARPAPTPPALHVPNVPPPVARVREPARSPIAATPPVAPSTGAGPAMLEEASLLANQGQFDAAAVRCEEYLRQHRPSAEAFCLLGLVNDARGNLSEAADCYRKAIYLDPRHQEALMHLTLLMEQQGRKSDAQLLRARSRRLERMSAT
jgi:chemotaxis protein methyltransferase WspC